MQNKFAITMTAYKRPEYLRQALDSLRLCDGKEQFDLHIGLEPGVREVADICDSVDWMNRTVHRNVERLGVRKNPFELLSGVFNAGYSGVLYLEDDIVVARDAVRLALWYFDNARPEEICLNLYNHRSSRANPGQIVQSDTFSSLGLVICPFQWTLVGAAWWADQRGWDFGFNSEMQAGKKVVCPSASRSHHIGRDGGTHYVKRLHDKIYVNNYLYDGGDVEFQRTT